jgi:hypothetical protein
MAIRCRSTRSHKPTPQAPRTQESGRLVPGKLKIFGPEPDIRLAVNPFGGAMTDRSVRLPIYSLHSSRKMAFEQRMDIMLTYWHWLEYDSVALATLFTGIGLVALLVLSI